MDPSIYIYIYIYINIKNNNRRPSFFLFFGGRIIEDLITLGMPNKCFLKRKFLLKNNLAVIFFGFFFFFFFFFLGGRYFLVVEVTNILSTKWRISGVTKIHKSHSTNRYSNWLGFQKKRSLRNIIYENNLRKPHFSNDRK